jgi:hypothetical protein
VRVEIRHNRHDSTPIAAQSGKTPNFAERVPSAFCGESGRRSMHSTAPKFNSGKVDTPDMTLNRRAVRSG